MAIFVANALAITWFLNLVHFGDERLFANEQFRLENATAMFWLLTCSPIISVVQFVASAKLALAFAPTIVDDIMLELRIRSGDVETQIALTFTDSPHPLSPVLWAIIGTKVWSHRKLIYLFLKRFGCVTGRVSWSLFSFVGIERFPILVSGIVIIIAIVFIGTVIELL